MTLYSSLSLNISPLGKLFHIRENYFALGFLFSGFPLLCSILFLSNKYTSDLSDDIVRFLSYLFSMLTLFPPEFAVVFKSPDSNWLFFLDNSLLVLSPTPAPKAQCLGIPS